jgi:hypothetical protein
MPDLVMTVVLWAGWLPVAVLVALVGIGAYRLGLKVGLTRHDQDCWITHRPVRDWEAERLPQ